MLAAALLMLQASAQPGLVELRIWGRENVTVDRSSIVYRGFCDGREVSATVIKAYRGAGGRLILRAGKHVRRVPDSFLGGKLFGDSFQAAGLGCDGRRVMLYARVAFIDSAGAPAVQVQSVTLDIKTGELKVNPVRAAPPEDVLFELREGG